MNVLLSQTKMPSGLDGLFPSASVKSTQTGALGHSKIILVHECTDKKGGGLVLGSFLGTIFFLYVSTLALTNSVILDKLLNLS